MSTEGLMKQIEIMIDEEVQVRLRASMDPFIGHVSKAYDISSNQLYREYINTMSHTRDDMCKGMTGRNKTCARKAKQNGFCALHQIQFKPVPAAPRIIPAASVAAPAQCGTDRKNSVRDVPSCFINE